MTKCPLFRSESGPFLLTLGRRLGLEGKALAAHGSLVHEPTLGHGEDRHAVLEIGASGGAGGDGHSRNLGAELQLARGELLVGLLVFKEDDFPEGLPA